MTETGTRAVAFGAFRLEPENRRLTRDGTDVPLPLKAIDLLATLLERPGQVFTKDELLRRLWPDSVVEEANLTVNISALRKALGESAGRPRYIATVAGVGYKFVGPASEVVPSVDPGPTPVIATRRSPAARLALTAGAVLLVLLTIVVGRNMVADRRGSAPTSPRLLPLTSSPGLKSHPSFSPDGRQLAFSWIADERGDADIYIRQVDGEGLLRLTQHAAAESNPVWSPDGRTIAFLRTHAAGSSLYLVPSLGGAERKVTDVPPGPFLSNLAWSPDGAHLAVSDRAADNRRCIMLITIATGERRQITWPGTPTEMDGAPAFSPDGSRVAFVRGTSFFVGDVYVTPVAGGQPARVTFDNRWVMGLTWTADGQSLVLSSNRGGLMALWRVRVTGGSVEPLPGSGPDAVFPAVSRDGDMLAYARWRADSNIWRLPGPAQPSADPTPARLIASTREDALPQYSPDGERIAFVSTRSGGEEIWLADADGQNQTRLTALDGGPGGTPRWSPDGRRIAFDWRRLGHADIYTMNAAGGTALRLTSEPSEDVVPAWSRDGRWVYFASNRGGSQQIWKAPADGGPASQVTRNGGFEPFESLDGRTLYFIRRGGLWRQPTAGGAETLVRDSVDWGGWAVVRQGIVLINRRDPTRHSIERLDVATGAVRQITVIDRGLRVEPSPPGFAVSPDERWILVKRVDQADHDLLVLQMRRGPA